MQPEPEGEQRVHRAQGEGELLLWCRAWTFGYVRWPILLAKQVSQWQTVTWQSKESWLVPWHIFPHHHFSSPPNRAEFKLLKQWEENGKKKAWRCIKHAMFFSVYLLIYAVLLLGCKIDHAFCRLDGKTKRYSYTCTVHYWIRVSNQSFQCKKKQTLRQWAFVHLCAVPPWVGRLICQELGFSNPPEGYQSKDMQGTGILNDCVDWDRPPIWCKLRQRSWL